MQWFDDDGGSAENQSQHAFEFETQMYTILDRIFSLEWKDVRQMKHKITPSLTYTYRDHLDLDQQSPWFERVNAEGDVNQLTFAVDNLFDVKRKTAKGGVTYSQFGSFGLSQAYNIKRDRRQGPSEEKKERFGPLIGTLLWRPLTGIHADATAHWDHYSGDVSFADISTQLTLDRSGARQDIYRLNYQYEREKNNNLSTYIDMNLINQLSAGMSAIWDLDEDNMIENRYWLQYSSQCWTVRLEVGKTSDIESITISLELMGFGG
jgi:lipopolysaccharide assembly outer membrane protein LptD (OstA)